MATKRKPKKEDLAFLVGAVTVGASMAKNAYAKARYSMKGNRLEDIKVKRIVKGTSKAPSISLSKSMFINARINSLPLGGNPETWIVEAVNGDKFLIGTGNLSLRKEMRIGETYRCKVFGDPDWGTPKIVEMIDNIKNLNEDGASDEADDTLILGDD